jgi:hypothetical protein
MGILVSLHRPACIADARLIFSANKSCPRPAPAAQRRGSAFRTSVRCHVLRQLSSAPLHLRRSCHRSPPRQDLLSVSHRHYSPSAGPFVHPCTRPARRVRRASPTRLPESQPKPFDSVATSCGNHHPRPCSLAARAIPPRAARTRSPYLIGMRVSRHLPACITELKSIFSAKRSCAAPTRAE